MKIAIERLREAAKAMYQAAQALERLETEEASKHATEMFNAVEMVMDWVKALERAGFPAHF